MKKLIAGFLAAGLLLASPGLAPYQAFAAGTVESSRGAPAPLAVVGAAAPKLVLPGAGPGLGLPALPPVSIDAGPAVETGAAPAAAPVSAPAAAPRAESAAPALAAPAAAAQAASAADSAGSAPAVRVIEKLAQTPELAEIADPRVADKTGALDWFFARARPRGAIDDVAAPVGASASPAHLGRSSSSASRSSEVPPAAAPQARAAAWLRTGARLGLSLSVLGLIDDLLFSGLGADPASHWFGLAKGVFLFWGVVESLVLHENAHALVAERMGDVSARMAGQISLNPLRFLNAGTSAALLITGLLGVPFGVLFTVMQPKLLLDGSQKRRMALVALAGPVMNLALAAILAAALLGAKAAIPPLAAAGWAAGLARSVGTLVWLNAVLGVLNLVPMGPLDGQKVLRAFIHSKVLKIFDIVTIVAGLLAILGFMGRDIWHALVAVFHNDWSHTPIGQLHDPVVLGFVASGVLLCGAAMLPWFLGRLKRLKPLLKRAKAALARRPAEAVAPVQRDTPTETIKTLPPPASQAASAAPAREPSEAPSFPERSIRVKAYTLRGKLPRPASWARAATVPAAVDEAAFPPGDYALSELDDFKYPEGFGIPMPATGKRYAPDERLRARLEAGRLILIRQGDGDKLTVALVDSSAVGGASRAIWLRETNAVSRAFHEESASRTLLTRTQVKVVKRLSKLLKAPVYEILWEAEPAYRRLGSYIRAEKGPMFFVSVKALKAVEADPDPAARTEALGRYLEILRRATAEGRSLAWVHGEYLSRNPDFAAWVSAAGL